MRSLSGVAGDAELVRAFIAALIAVDPPAGMLVAGLTAEQQETVGRLLEAMLRERPAVEEPA